MRIGIWVGFALAAGLTVAVLGGSVRAEASGVCAAASTSGTLLGTHSLSGPCVPYSGQLDCRSTTAGVDPTALVTVNYCLPAPVTGTAGA